MPIPSWVGVVNKHVSNRVMLRLAGHPPFAALHHRGRRSGRTYRIPITVVRSGDDFVVALTYGRHTDWVRNVMAAGGAEIEYGGREIALTHPRIVPLSSAASASPGWVRAMLRAIRVGEALLLRDASADMSR